jgi:hypothetical protein
MALSETKVLSQGAAPQLNAITLTSGQSATAGSPIIYAFSLTAGSSPVEGVALLANDPSGFQEFLTGNIAAGTITFTPPAYWLNGTYTVTDVDISDGVGVTDYSANGTVTFPTGETGPTTDPVTSGLDFVLAGASESVVGPTLNSVSLVSNTVTEGGSLEVNFNTTPGTTNRVLSVGLVTAGPNGSTGLGVSGSPGAITVDLYLSGFVPGNYTVTGVTLTDGQGVEYFTSNLGTLAMGETPGGATINFSALSFTVVAAPTPTPTPTPTSAVQPTPTPTPASTPTPAPTPTPTPVATPTPLPTPTPTPNPSGIVITAQPLSVNAMTGEGVNFSVSATGPTGLIYQWFLNGSAVSGATASTYSIASAQPAAAGSYTVSVSAGGTTVTSQGAVLAVAPITGGPAVSTQPASALVASGTTVVFNTGTTSPGATYQWYLNGTPLAGLSAQSLLPNISTRAVVGANSSTLLIPDATVANSGNYSCLVSTSAGSVVTNAATLNISSTSDPGRLTDLSCRAQVGTGGNILITGFSVGGEGTSGGESVLARGSGPALIPFNVTGTLPDPTITLFNSQEQQIASNSGWAGSQAIAAAATQVGAFTWTVPASHDSALLETLPAGSYTAQVYGASGDTGVALAEVYDDTPAGEFNATTPRLINVSARISAGTGPNILIAGFVIGGTTSKTVLIRASGPALNALSVTGTLPDPQVQLFNSSGQVLASNTGWGGDPQIALAASMVGAFTWGSAATPDSALLLTLPPGSYTAQVSGASGDTGIALVEVYDVQ